MINSIINISNILENSQIIFNWLLSILLVIIPLGIIVISVFFILKLLKNTSYKFLLVIASIIDEINFIFQYYKKTSLLFKYLLREIKYYRFRKNLKVGDIVYALDSINNSNYIEKQFKIVEFVEIFKNTVRISDVEQENKRHLASISRVYPYPILK